MRDGAYLPLRGLRRGGRHATVLRKPSHRLIFIRFQIFIGAILRDDPGAPDVAQLELAVETLQKAERGLLCQFSILHADGGRQESGLIRLLVLEPFGRGPWRRQLPVISGEAPPRSALACLSVRVKRDPRCG